MSLSAVRYVLYPLLIAFRPLNHELPSCSHIQVRNYDSNCRYQTKLGLTRRSKTSVIVSFVSTQTTDSDLRECIIYSARRWPLIRITVLDPRIVGFRRKHSFLYSQVMVKLKAPRVGKSSRRVIICLLIAGVVVSRCLYNTPLLQKSRILDVIICTLIVRLAVLLAVDFRLFVIYKQTFTHFLLIFLSCRSRFIIWLCSCFLCADHLDLYCH